MVKKNQLINLLNGDRLKLLEKSPYKSIDLILTNPPHGITGCRWDNILPFDLMWEQLSRTKGYVKFCTFSPISLLEFKRDEKHSAPNFKTINSIRIFNKNTPSK